MVICSFDSLLNSFFCFLNDIMCIVGLVSASFKVLPYLSDLSILIYAVFHHGCVSVFI